MTFPPGPFFAKLGAEDMRELAICAAARGIDIEAAAEAALALELVAAECADYVALHAGGVWAVGGGAGTAWAVDRAAAECSDCVARRAGDVWGPAGGAEASAAWSEKTAWSRAGAGLRTFLRWKRILSAWAVARFSGPLRKQPASAGSEAGDPRCLDETQPPCGEGFDSGGVAVRGAALQNLEALCGGDPEKASAVLSRAVRRLELLDSLAALGGALGGTVRGRGRLLEIRMWDA